MGNKNKQRQYEASAAAAEAERKRKATELEDGSAEYKAYSERIGKRRAAIDKGDLSNAVDFIGNSANQALINRKREATWNATPTGMMAVGNNYANPNAVAQQTQMLKDMQARDSAGQLESDWQDYIGDTQAAESGMVSRRDNIDMTLMGSADSRSARYDEIARRIAAQRSNMWAGILGGGIGAAGSIISAGMS